MAEELLLPAATALAKKLWLKTNEKHLKKLHRQVSSQINDMSSFIFICQVQKAIYCTHICTDGAAVVMRDREAGILSEKGKS